MLSCRAEKVALIMCCPFANMFSNKHRITQKPFSALKDGILKFKITLECAVLLKISLEINTRGNIKTIL